MKSILSISFVALLFLTACNNSTQTPKKEKVPVKHQINYLSTSNPSHPVVVSVNLEDEKVVKNINNVLALYDMMINQKRSEKTCLFRDPTDQSAPHGPSPTTAQCLAPCPCHHRHDAL